MQLFVPSVRTAFVVSDVKLAYQIVDLFMTSCDKWAIFLLRVLCAGVIAVVCQNNRWSSFRKGGSVLVGV